MSRLVFIGITIFWVTMNVLLWRAEYGSQVSGSVMSPEVVWQKILTAPDSSSLSIVQHGIKIGFCHWLTGVGEQWGEVSDENLPTGMPAKALGYRLRVEGALRMRDRTNQVRFEGELALGPDRLWREVDVRLHVRPTDLEIHSRAAEQSVRLKSDTDGGHFERTFSFSDLQNPATLVTQLTGVPAPWLEGMAVPGRGAARVSFGIKWEAREDWLQVGHSRMSVYRLETRVLDRYQARLFVSRVGEILRVELPNGLVLVNDALFIL